MGEISELYEKSIRDRIKQLMQLSGLTIEGFAEFIHVSKSHLYNVLNTTRSPSIDLIQKIKFAFPFRKGDFTLLNLPINSQNINFDRLNKFKDENSGVITFFISSKESISLLIKNRLLVDKFVFGYPILVSSVRQYWVGLGKKYSSKQISQALEYLANTGFLRKASKPILLKNGTSGRRIVCAYFLRKGE